MEHKQIALEILKQLEGNRFVAMVGAKQISAEQLNREHHGLSFKIGRNAKGINRVKIAYNEGLDLYNLEFCKESLSVKKGYSCKVVEEFSGVYCDQLAEIFESSTGLYTKLQ